MDKPRTGIGGKTGRAHAIVPAVPPGRSDRARLLAAVRAYAAQHVIVPPQPLDELRQHAQAVLNAAGGDPAWMDFVTVLISNEVWRGTITSVPFERRLLLLPQCLRDRHACQAAIDEFGLLCEQCGRCIIGALQEEAERLGYVVLVAEGTSVVINLLEQGRIDAVIGVSCLPVLERTFPHAAAEAVPAVAIPLVNDGCIDTQVDVDWIREAIYLQADVDASGRVDFDVVRHDVDTWFAPDCLRDVIDPACGRAAELAYDWLLRGGKRWRPFLTACTYAAFSGRHRELPDMLRRLAYAVEFFHKASLIHDDIEDNDDLRYGKDTLHRQHGIPAALNTGDLLIGEGYRLIAACGAPDTITRQLLNVAADAHRRLCLGQGEDLYRMNLGAPLRLAQVLDIYRNKTAPAFEVALLLGALAAEAGEEVCDALCRYSNALGIAYQLRDDLEDADPQGEDARYERPLLKLALADAAAENDDQRRRLAALWKGRLTEPALSGEWDSLRRALALDEKADQLYQHYRREAVRSLASLQHAPLKSLLRRVVSRVLPAPHGAADQG